MDKLIVDKTPQTGTLQILGAGETKNVVKLTIEVGKPLKMTCCNTFEVEKGNIESVTESGKGNYFIKFEDGNSGTFFIK